MEELIDEILDIFIENVSCSHSPDSDGSGQVFDHVEYDIDEARVKEKIKELLMKTQAEPSEELAKERAKERALAVLRAMKETCRALEALGKIAWIAGDWLPTAENIEALPEPVRMYIAELETNCDPPSLVRDNIIIKENIKALEIKLKEAEAKK